MISGLRALGGLSVEVANARERFDELAPRVEELAREHSRLLAQEEDTLHELARVYFPELSREALAGGLSELRQDLEEDLEEALAGLAQRRAELREEVARADAAVDQDQRALLEAEAEDASLAAVLEKRAEAVEAILGADTEYARWGAEHEALIARQEVLKKRRAQLASTGRYECRRYDEYRPFAYLMARGYGGPEYRAGPLGRRLDRWLASQSDFDTLRRSYLILRDGPGLIHREILDLRNRAAELEARIDGREAEVGAREGLMEAAEASTACEQRLAEGRPALEARRAHRDALVAELQAVELNRGAAYERLLDRHTDFLESQTMSELAERAMETADPRDDVLVQRLHEVRRRIIDSGRDLTAHRKELHRLAELTGRLAEAKRAAATRFYSRRSRFPDDFRLQDALSPLVDGDATAAHLVDQLRQVHVTAPPLGPLATGLTRALAGLLGLTSPAFGLGFEVVESAEEGDVETDYVVYGPDGRILERRVTRRRKR
ncbi:MAG TPA: hypothetical protein VGA70_05945 [Longimicrobiales bacterium]